MSKRIGLGILIAAGLLAFPSAGSFAQTEEHAATDKTFVVPELSDEEMKTQINTLKEAFASGDQNTIRMALGRHNLIARGLSNNRAVSDEQVKAIVAAVNELKDAHGDYAKQLDQFIFQVENLTIGRVAPNIEGVDTDEVEFELNDYQGKVVVIDFWGDW